MPIIRWNPLHDLEEDIFEDLSYRPFHAANWDLATDIGEDDTHVHVEIHIPGINPDKIDIEVSDNHLHVKGSREREQEVEDRHYYKKEIRRGSFERIIALPAEVIGDQARAEFKDGVLHILLPKVKNESAKKVKVTRKQ